MQLIKYITLLALFSSSVLLHSKDEWKSRTIYQLITDRFWRTDGSTAGCADIHKYCGGTWKGIEDQLDYIKNMGFDAIWISPMPENYGDDYHGYAALNWYNPNPHFGDANSLKSMINTAHSKGIWVMLDVVANHVAYIDTDYGKVTPFNDGSHYHTKCQINNWGDANEVEYCRLSNLPDLNQDNQFVRDTLKKWVKDTVSEYNFDGIRVDTVPHVKVPFWKEYSQAAGVFSIGEALNGDIGYVSNFANNALDATLNYPLYFTMKNVFNYKQSMYQIRTTLNGEKNAFHDMDALGVFVDNHDNPRFLSMTYSIPLFKSALTFALFAQGIPIVYYGSEQGYAGGADPNNRETLWNTMNPNSELYKYLQTVVSVRKSHQVWKEQHVERYVNDKFYAFSRGQVLVALTNDDQGTQSILVSYHPFSAGQTVCNKLKQNDCTQVGNNGVQITLQGGEAKIYVPANSETEQVAQDFLAFE
ncbi:alpha catalytic domain containing protein [Stylonychia lemnae]|uniref:Alpha-amylase n=1 Tax=Stylonychia lemnae TaxID=5949 RepID=A0A078AS24_STYLE|nr:alpha catalytic domain containing protein [Stylonychia lemnae]|eukprot:CDW84776.1 alpha catalytic domain containing protein [Stylonychia lemnae]